MGDGWRIAFCEVDAPICKPVTKFGGQPAWIDGPSWPLSRKTGRPMRFIGQVALDPSTFGDVPARMAYLFMTDEDDGNARTWEADGGENAVVLQPGPFEGPVRPLIEGPTVYRMAERPGLPQAFQKSCEFTVDLTAYEPTEDGFANQVGGMPEFLQSEQYPRGGPWRLLLQLDSQSVPFCLNLGDAGVGYAFLAEDGTSAKFLWQCC